VVFRSRFLTDIFKEHISNTPPPPHSLYISSPAHLPSLDRRFRSYTDHHAVCTIPLCRSPCSLHYPIMQITMQSALSHYADHHAVCTIPLCRSPCSLHYPIMQITMQSALSHYADHHAVCTIPLCRSPCSLHYPIMQITLQSALSHYSL